MDLIKAKQGVESILKKCNFKYVVEEKGNYVHAKAVNVRLKGIDDDITLEICVYQNGAGIIELIFDKINNIKKVIEDINELNRAQPWGKAYINDYNFFVVGYYFAFVQDVDVEKHIGFALTNFGDDKFISLLKPITKITKA